MLYIAGAVVLLYLFTRKSSPAAAATSVNADMGGADFGVTDPSSW